MAVTLASLSPAASAGVGGGGGGGGGGGVGTVHQGTLLNVVKSIFHDYGMKSFTNFILKNLFIFLYLLYFLIWFKFKF